MSIAAPPILAWEDIVFRPSDPGEGDQEPWHARHSQVPFRTPSRPWPPAGGARRAAASSRKQESRRSASACSAASRHPPAQRPLRGSSSSARGLAGLSAAYALRNAGYTAEVHEASDRIGGRCWTLRGAFADGQIAEHGGELIDQSHSHIRQLAQGLGLKLDNLLQAEQNGTELIAYFDGSHYRVRGDDRRHQGRLAEDPCRRLGGELPDHVRALDRARPRARQHVDRRLHRGDVRGRDRLSDREAP